jgi:hypothetical protein
MTTREKFLPTFSEIETSVLEVPNPYQGKRCDQIALSIWVLHYSLLLFILMAVSLIFDKALLPLLRIT